MTSLYEQVLGAQFGALHEPVRRFHSLAGRHQLHGWVRVEAPGSVLASLLALCLGAPTAAGSGALRFELDAHADHEVWTRHFPSRTMRSCLRPGGRGLIEQLGLARLSFGLETCDGKLVMRLQRLQVLGLPCPAWAMPRIVAEETGQADQLHFDVQASLPLIGQVVHYVGHLEVGPKASA